MQSFKGLLAIVLVAVSCGALADDSALQQLRGKGYIALMRHALAPGTGDPSNFIVDDCSTQRNLNEVGRVQASETGDYLRKAGVQFHAVYSSEWCRCMETAQLMALGDVQSLPQINSFFQQMSERDSRNEALLLWLAKQTIEKPLLLVTHQVNITALTGVYPQSGEVVVGRMVEGAFEVTGTIDPR